MFRFVSCIWDAADAESALKAEEVSCRLRMQGGWSCVFRRPGLEVHVTGSRPRASEVYTLGGESGVILGKLFTRTDDGSDHSRLRLTDETTQNIMARGGRDLITRYWGRYVAFLYDANNQTIRVLRGPSTSLPCLTTRLDRLHVYCSWIEDLTLLGLDKWTINWPVVQAYLCNAPPDFPQTGLNELLQVMGGECVIHQGGQSRREFYWDPIRTTLEVPDDMEGAARLLRSCVRDCVRAWQSCYDSIALRLSGGLDSSIIATCLDLSDPARVAFLNYFRPDSDSDERAYAQRVARHIGVELIESPHDSSLRLERLLEMHRVPVPTLCIHLLEFSRRTSEFCAKQGATAVFDGFGGDQVFYTAKGTPCAVSYTKEHGLRPRALGVMLDAAYRDKRSFWRVLQEVVQRDRQRARATGKYLALWKTLVEPDVIENVRQHQLTFVNPLLRNEEGADPGRLLHAEEVLPPYDFYDPFCSGPNDPENVSPILSQPLIELCLSMPRHLLIRGGWTRAVARHAFRDRLPNEIVAHPEKGGVEDHIRTVLQHNAAFVRERLLDGELTRKHIINREGVRMALARDPTRSQTSITELGILLCAEAWLSRFQ